MQLNHPKEMDLSSLIHSVPLLNWNFRDLNLCCLGVFSFCLKTLPFVFLFILDICLVFRIWRNRWPEILDPWCKYLGFTFYSPTQKKRPFRLGGVSFLKFFDEKSSGRSFRSTSGPTRFHFGVNHYNG